MNRHKLTIGTMRRQHMPAPAALCTGKRTSESTMPTPDQLSHPTFSYR